MANEVARRGLRAVPLCAGAAALAVLAACAKAPPPVDKEKPPAAPASVVAPAPSASAASAVPARTIPTLAPEKFAPDGAKLEAVYAVEGAIMVVEGYRVGRVVGDGIEWLKRTVPAGSPGLGASIVVSVVGRWPDSIGAIYTTSQGRALEPTYVPLTGVGLEYTAAPGGGLGEILGVARLGESTVVAGWAPGYGGFELATVRGTVVRKPQGADEAGCTAEEVPIESYGRARVGIEGSVVGASKAGTLMSIGRLCGKRGPAAEIWDRSGKSRIVDLTPFWKGTSYWPKILQGEGDELWLFSDMWRRVLRYHEGAFEAVADLPRPTEELFVSPSGRLHAYDGRTILRYEGGKWIAVARLAKAEPLHRIAMDDQGTFWVAHLGVERLRPAPDAEPEPEGCATPFVYLYKASDKNGPSYTYPATRKALATFPQVGDLRLVEIGEDAWDKHLGVTVKSMAEGEAVIAHLRQTMKDEDPRLFCYAPQKAREIDMNAKD